MNVKSALVLFAMLSVNNSNGHYHASESVFKQTCDTVSAVSKAALQTIHTHPYIASFVIVSSLINHPKKPDFSDFMCFLGAQIVLGNVIKTSTGFVLKNLEVNNQHRNMIMIKDVDSLCNQCKKKLRR